MALEDLLEIQVTSVSRRPEPWFTAASEIQVVQGEDVRRSAATGLVDALRLLANTRVASSSSHGSVVTARGFSGTLANKLLVRIDGRNVYTPLFAGVFWDAQEVFLEDLDRIEVVSGPGGTLWGANAVNGVVNIISKQASATQGTFVSAAAGDALKSWVGVRHGGRAGATGAFRVYGQRFDRDASRLPSGARALDAWNLTQFGFRGDWQPRETDLVTIQSEATSGREEASPGHSKFEGQHLLGRFRRAADGSRRVVQFYADRTWRFGGVNFLTDRLETYDLDYNESRRASGPHYFSWGGNVRFMDSSTKNGSNQVAFVPNERTMWLYSAFLQDELTFREGRVRLTAGIKVEHGEFSGLDLQPNVRLAWLPTENQTYWTAISRAVRAPSRIDVDAFLPAIPPTPTSPQLAGGPGLDSEKVTAYEAGYRIKPGTKMTFSVSLYYNHYDDLAALEAPPGSSVFHFRNAIAGQTHGAELTATIQPSDSWRIRAGYNYFEKSLWSKPGHSALFSTHGNDPRHQMSVHSMLDLPRGIQFDLTGRYVSALPQPRIPGYATFDARIGWQAGVWEFSIAGRDLADRSHPEFGAQETRRSFFGKVTWRR